MIAGIEITVFIFFAVIPFALMVLAIADIIKREMPVNEKIAWAFLSIVFVFAGPILYFYFKRRAISLRHKHA